MTGVDQAPASTATIPYHMAVGIVYESAGKCGCMNLVCASWICSISNK